MKTFIRNTAYNSFALFLASQIFPLAITIRGGLQTLFLAGLALMLMSFLLKPILNLIALPITLLTFGLFSFVTNAVILYLLTIFVQNISITAFIFKGISFSGFTIPSIHLNTFFAFVLVSFVLSGILSFVKWLTQ